MSGLDYWFKALCKNDWNSSDKIPMDGEEVTVIVLDSDDRVTVCKARYKQTENSYIGVRGSFSGKRIFRVKAWR